MTLPDITTEADVALFVARFYERIRQDPDLGPIFNTVAQVDWPTHLPNIERFWSTMLLNTGTYTGNPMPVHFNLARKTPIRPAHFDQWLALFRQTLTEHFAGERTNEALLRAQGIATVMQGRLAGMDLLVEN
ncbi:group III truncated hemoglobin [Fibrella aquatilis]|nr:group III truncated hemoglobin [Fibrella aquatilis]